MISAFNRVSTEHTKIVSKKPKHFLETFYSFYKCKTFCHQKRFATNLVLILHSPQKNPLIDFFSLTKHHKIWNIFYPKQTGPKFKITNPRHFVSKK